MFIGAVAMNINIYVFGGKIMNTSNSNTFEIYHPHNNKWIISNAYIMKKDLCHIYVIVIENNSELFKKAIEEATYTIIH